MKHLNDNFQNSKLFENRLNRYRENRHPNMTQIEHVYAICCQLEVAGDVISGDNVKTVEGYAVLNFEVVSYSIFRKILLKNVS